MAKRTVAELAIGVLWQSEPALRRSTRYDTARRSTATWRTWRGSNQRSFSLLFTSGSLKPARKHGPSRWPVDRDDEDLGSSAGLFLLLTIVVDRGRSVFATRTDPDSRDQGFNSWDKGPWRPCNPFTYAGR